MWFTGINWLLQNIVTPFLRPSQFSFEMSFVTAESYACAYVAHLIAFLCLVYCLSLKW
jgi:hypothetical protein